MRKPDIHIVKASGERSIFSMDKVIASLKRSGAKPNLITQITDQLEKELYEGISTKEIYNRAYTLLKKANSSTASRYKLKRAIYELGPTGYPFERFIAAILKYSGYEVEVGKIITGACVNHEVDVVATKKDQVSLIECKFHSDQGRYCNVKVPLYIHSRFRDIKAQNNIKEANKLQLKDCWVVTNTRFTSDAIKYGKCANLYLLSWDMPAESSLKKRIDDTGLYPITVSTLLTKREKQFLLSRDVVLCRELLDDKFYLDHLEVSDTRKRKILEEMQLLCNVKNEES